LRAELHFAQEGRRAVLKEACSVGTCNKRPATLRSLGEKRGHLSLFARSGQRMASALQHIGRTGPATGLRSDWDETASRFVKREQRSARDAEIGAVEGELALPFPRRDPRKAAQIDEALTNRRQGEALGIGVEGTARLNARRCGLDEADPFANEIASGKRLMPRLGLTVCKGAHPAAARMAHDHDMGNAKAKYRKFERRRSAVEIIIRAVRRHKIGDVAQNKELAGFGVKDDLRRDPRIAAADDHDPRRLPGGGQMTETVLFPGEPRAKKGFIAFNKPPRQKLWTISAARTRGVFHGSIPRLKGRSTPDSDTARKGSSLAAANVRGPSA